MSYEDLPDLDSVGPGNNIIAGDERAKHVSYQLREMYNTIIKPLEETYNYEKYKNKPIPGSFFDSEPVILILGPKNAGKTSFIKQIIGREYPGMELGADASTEKFTIVTGGERDHVVPGDIATLSEDRLLKGLSDLGNAFSKRYMKVTCNADALKSMWLVDTPRLDQYYDAVEMKGIQWLAKISWKIIVFFDATKLRFNSQTRENLSYLRKYEDKLEFVLNKSHLVKEESLFRQYGMLLTKIHNTFKSENKDMNFNVYISSFPGHQMEFNINRPLSTLFYKQSNELFAMLNKSARIGVDQKVTVVERRAKRAVWHAEIMLLLRGRIPRRKRVRSYEEHIAEIKLLLDEAVTQVRAERRDYALGVEKYPPKFTDEKFKFSKERKKIERVDRFLKAGVPLLRKQLYGSKSFEDAQIKLVRLGLLKNQKRIKQNLKKTKSRKLNRGKSNRKVSVAPSRASTSSAVSPVAAGSIADNAFGTFSVVSGDSFQSRRTKRGRSKNKMRRQKNTDQRLTLQEKYIDNQSLASEEVYTYKRQNSSRNTKQTSKSAGFKEKNRILMNLTGGEGKNVPIDEDDHIDLYSSLAEDNGLEDPVKSSRRSKKESPTKQGNRNAPSTRRVTSFLSTGYNVCNVFGSSRSRNNRRN